MDIPNLQDLPEEAVSVRNPFLPTAQVSTIERLMDHATTSPSSPNAIPRRTSSMGIKTSPAKPVLRPLSEEHWISKATDPRFSYDGTSSPKPKRMVNGNGTSHHRQQASFGSDLIDQELRIWPEDKEKVLMGPYDYMENHPGKDIRSQLIAAFNTWLQVPRESLTVITKVVGMLHTSSLLYVAPDPRHVVLMLTS